MMSKIGIIGDLHLKKLLNYHEYIADKRVKEESDILNFIVKEFNDCDSVVFLGDQLNSKNNQSSVIKKFVNFIEQFEDKNLYIIAGNHEKTGSGDSAIDFLKEIKGKHHWNIIVSDIFYDKIDNLTCCFCPHFSVVELDETDNKKASNNILTKIKNGGDILFCHQAISDTLSNSGTNTSLFNEPVLSKIKVEKLFKKIVGGHIHSPAKYDNTIISGSVFCNELGETEKFIWKIDSEDLSVEQIKLPGRGIYKLENKSIESLNDIGINNIVKVITEGDCSPEIKKKLKEFDAYLIVEKKLQERKKIDIPEGDDLLDYSIEKLLEFYAKEKNIDKKKLLNGFNLIR